MIVRLNIIGLVSLPDYDIRIRDLAGFVPLAASASTAPLRQLRGQGVPDRHHRRSLLPDGVGPPPIVGIVGQQLRGQHVALLGRPGAACDALHQFGVALPQSLGVGRAHRLPQWRVIVGHFTRRRGRTFGTCLPASAGGFAATFTALAVFRTGLALNGRGITQQPVPVEGEIRMGVLERFADFRVQRLAAHLHV